MTIFIFKKKPISKLKTSICKICQPINTTVFVGQLTASQRHAIMQLVNKYSEHVTLMYSYHNIQGYNIVSSDSKIFDNIQLLKIN